MQKFLTYLSSKPVWFSAATLFLIASVASAQSWSAPPAGTTPPANNVANILNISATTQTKAGALGVNALTANGVTVTGTVTGQQYCIGASCITAWPAGSGGTITGSGTAGYLPKFTTATNLAGSQIYDNGTNVGVGEASPAQKLDVAGSIRMEGTTLFTAGSNSTYGAITVEGSKGGWSGINFKIGGTNTKTLMMHGTYSGVYNTADNGWDWYWTNGTLTAGTVPAANIGVGNLNLGSGTATAAAFYYSSDSRLKKNIEPIKGALAKIVALNGVSYNWKDAGRGTDKELGLIAQEVEAVAPELVTTDDKGYKAVDYARVVPLLVEAMKEQQRHIEAQDARIQSLEQHLGDIYSR